MSAGFPAEVEIYDTTLRDGSQQEGISLSVDDKLKVARQLDALGVHYIEGGWPGANPKDAAFFARARDELALHTAQLVAFGSTRRASTTAESDPNLAALTNAGVGLACIVAKAWDVHVIHALRTSLPEAVAMVADSVRWLVDHGIRVMLDAEHFFDGWRHDRSFALDVLAAAADAGAERLVLCDTNGGTLPDDVGPIVDDVRAAVATPLGVHFHNDSGCAVANSLLAVAHGVIQVQGCMNGYGERTGNANLVPVIAGLSLKRSVRTIPPENLELLTTVSRHIAELTNQPLPPQSPYVGASAFTHKAGLHVSAIARRRDAYEHIDPTLVGNTTRFVVSEMAGRQSIQLKATQLGIDLGEDDIAEVLRRLKDLEHRGYHFEAADGSLELLLRRASGWTLDDVAVESYRTISDCMTDGPRATEATVKLTVNDRRVIATAEGNGPVNALDEALRAALDPAFPLLKTVKLTDFKVRVLDSDQGTDATVRVLIDFQDPEDTWTTTGVSTNVIDASFEALLDGLIVAIARARDRGEEW
ncbi:2-isopropylmalate synthase/homocitrate synthase family protein [Acidimicrobium ferrooxidans DSM 10331]|uniref:Citramalate synthase n=1 Tax=Acidimicrobium ferrooxidans (strain DSM 10331 / JCM 15462 / NBRC 103882 / ICP) TaxID=525909 RepID=C7M0F3_ACIFD|nr:citramalate synthase [Acidimicrobium ferrooxidans]ACU54461.1 2-isopropylmalate synthase/homocitrate synthase family protein [Acidimicrobium ferrooxidans DSM 10331]